jgi:hypothetical protein
MTAQGAELDALHTALARYDLIALVANNETLDIDAVRRSLPERTLFFFFTGCEKILTRRFEGDAALCHRLVTETSFLKAPKYFRMAYSLLPEHLVAEVGILADRGAASVPARPAPRESTLVPHLVDFDVEFPGFYPEGRMPTTGFALALHLLEACPTARICLCGFSGVAGLRYTVYPEHDWTFEQTLIQLFVRSGRLMRTDAAGGQALDDPFEAITRRYPEFGTDVVALTASQVLASRFTGMERQMAHLWKQTRVRRTLNNAWRRLRRSLGGTSRDASEP